LKLLSTFTATHYITNMKTFYLIIFSLKCGFLFSQVVWTEDYFGANGRVELKAKFVDRIFYDSYDRSIYICYNIVDIIFEPELEYTYHDGVYNIDADTGELIGDFSEDGHAYNTVSFNHLDRGNSNWLSTDTEIFCINNNTETRTSFMFDKHSGEILNFLIPNPHKFPRFILYDYYIDGFLASNDHKLYWYFPNGQYQEVDFSKIFKDDAKFLRFEKLNHKNESIDLRVCQYREEDSTWLCKLVSLEGLETTVLDSFQISEPHRCFTNYEQQRILINLVSKQLRYQFDLPQQKDNWISIQKSDTSYLNLVYANDTHIYLADLNTHDIEKFSLYSYELSSKEETRYTFEGILEPNMKIQDVIYTENNEFVLLVYKTYRSGFTKYYLYKIGID